VICSWLSDFLAANIIKTNPAYALFTNNCQNFSKLLAEAICGITIPVETIQDTLQRLFSPVIDGPNNPLPGAYPESIYSGRTTSSSYRTARMSFLSILTEESYYTARENWSFGGTIDLELSLYDGREALSRKPHGRSWGPLVSYMCWNASLLCESSRPLNWNGNITYFIKEFKRHS